MNTPKVSIIVPTYNVEKYLLQCLESIANQTYENYEVIIIIDGATDRSYEIAKKFCATHEKFAVYWQENAGSGPARNNGLDHANGELVMFVDPDDWINKDYIDSLLKLQEKGDFDLVTTCKTTIYFDNHSKIKKIRPSHFHEMSFTGEEQLHENYVLLFTEGAIQAPHCKIYKTSIIKNNNIRFPDLRRSQDIVFNYRYYDYIKSVIVSNYSGYMYRVVSSERSKRLKSDYYKTIKLIYHDLENLHNKWNIVFNKRIVCTVLYDAVYPFFESTLVRGENLKLVAEDITINDIIVNARPVKWHLCLVRILVLKGKYNIAAIIVRLFFYLKILLR